MTANGSNNTVTLEIIRASEVTPREVKWLWYPYIPFGKITLLQGDPGDGKSKFMLALSALLTDGKPLPFQEAEEASGPMTQMIRLYRGLSLPAAIGTTLSSSRRMKST